MDPGDDRLDCPARDELGGQSAFVLLAPGTGQRPPGGSGELGASRPTVGAAMLPVSAMADGRNACSTTRSGAGR